MADWGTFNGRSLAGAATINRSNGAGTVEGSTHTEFNINNGIGTINGRVIGGGEVVISYVDRIVYEDAPPSTNGVGDWGMRFYAARLEPSTVNGAGVTLVPDLYVCPAGSRLYIREFRLYNNMTSAQTAKLYFNGVPVFDGSVSTGISNEIVKQGLWILGPGELIEGSGPEHLSGVNDDGKGLWCWVSGIEERVAT